MTRVKGFLDDRTEQSPFVRSLTHPSARRFEETERFFRRAIPVLLICFLCLVALIRFAAMLEHRGELEADLEGDLKLAASFLAAESGTIEGNESLARNTLLTSHLPEGFVEDGRFVVVSLSDGKIAAASPGYEYLVGGDLLGELALSPVAIQFGRGERTISGIFGEEAIETASVRLAGSLGLATIVQIESAAMAGWRNTLAVNVSLFILTSIVVLATVIAYFQQASRASEADAAYMETHELVDTALSLGHSGLWDWNVSRGELQLSRSLYELLGMTAGRGSIGFDELEARLHPADFGVRHALRRVMSSNLDNFDKTFRLRHSDGRYLWMRARAEATRDKTGDRHLIGMAIDVCDEQALAERTRVAHEQLHNAIENIPETFVLCDDQDKIVLANSLYRRIFGLTEQDTRPGTHLGDVMRKMVKPIESNAIRSARFAEGSGASEIKMPNGHWLLLSERRTQDGFIAIGADITQLKIHQDRLRESESRLTDTIHSLTETRRNVEHKARELEALNASFRAEKDKAEAASRAKTTFLANMSHELRTPLNAILGFSDVMRQNMLGPLGSQKYCEYANDIHESGSFLLQLIDDILDMSKIETGRTRIVRERFDLTDAVSETIRRIEASCDGQGVELLVEQPETVEIAADRRAVVQILTNLLSNAVKFSEPGGTVRVSLKTRGDAVLLGVADQGEGIPRDNLKKIGLPFEQIESEWTRTKKGTGLGLAITRSLTELHGGRFRIASTLGEGTIVALRFPKAADEYPREA